MYDKMFQRECLFGGHVYLLHKLLRNIYEQRHAESKNCLQLQFCKSKNHRKYGQIALEVSHSS